MTITSGEASSAPEQLCLPGMPTRLFSCTPTRLITWLDSPRRYRFTYLDRPPPPKGPPCAHNSLGSSVHLALAGWHRLDARERSVEAAGRLLERVWLRDAFRDDEQAAACKARAREMVMCYVATLDPEVEPLGIERTVGMRTEVLAVSGRLDRLDLRDGPDGEVLVVVDYKTGRPGRLGVSQGAVQRRCRRALPDAGVAVLSFLRLRALVPRPGLRPTTHRPNLGLPSLWTGMPERS